MSARHQRGRTAMRSLGLALAAGSMIAWSGVAAAAPAPDSFSGLAKKVSPAVVNIASSHELGAEDMPQQAMPFEFPEGSPFEKFFRQFQDRMGPQGPQGRAPQGRRAMGLGSGFIIDAEGYIVTNNHVIDKADEISVRLDDDSSWTATVVGTDPQTDLALLKIDADRDLPFVSFGDSDSAEVGDWVMAVGNPFGLGGTVTAGIVSARGRNIDAGPYDDFLQIDAPINRGNSGGPLFDMDGAVVGVNSAIYSPNGGSVGIGFAIPSNLARSVVAQLREDGKVDRGWLGVQIQPVTPDIAAALGLDEAKGAMVVEVSPDSPAAKAGLSQGDVITRLGDTAIEDPRHLAMVVAQHQPGRDADMTVWRQGGRESVSVELGHQPAREQMAAAMSGGESGAEGSVHSPELQADLAALTPERRAQLGLGDEVQGVVVTDVKDGSVFEQGLRPGDVIRKIGGETVRSPREVEMLVEKAKSGAGEAVLLLVNRRGNDLFLGVKLAKA